MNDMPEPDQSYADVPDSGAPGADAHGRVAPDADVPEPAWPVHPDGEVDDPHDVDATDAGAAARDDAPATGVTDAFGDAPAQRSSPTHGLGSASGETGSPVHEADSPDHGLGADAGGSPVHGASSPGHGLGSPDASTDAETAEPYAGAETGQPYGGAEPAEPHTGAVPVEPHGDAEVPGVTRHLDAGEQPLGGRDEERPAEADRFE